MFSLAFSMKLFAKKTFYASTNFNQHENVMHSIDNRQPPFPHSSIYTFTNKLTRVNPPNKFERKRDQNIQKGLSIIPKLVKNSLKRIKLVQTVNTDAEYYDEPFMLLHWMLMMISIPFWRTWTIIIDVLLALRGLPFLE